MERVEILKTYKLFIDGKFVRSESGRTFNAQGARKQSLVQVPLASRKDFRNAVVVARKAFPLWSARAAFNRSQILYRIGEMLEAKKEQFIHELQAGGQTKNKATKEIENAIDLCVYYSGWCDKYSAVHSSVNPVSSSHFNFSMPEPMGVVAVIEGGSFLGILHGVLACIAGGNTCIAIADSRNALSALSLAEIINSSDVPAGVVNILSTEPKSIIEHISKHRDVNAILSKHNLREIHEWSESNLKRIIEWKDNKSSLQKILDFQEIKTTWHPIEKIVAKGGKY